MLFSRDRGLTPKNSADDWQKEAEEARRMDKRLLTIAEAAEWLNLSRSYLYKLVEGDEIPNIRFGRAIRFDVEKIDAWLQEDDEDEADPDDEVQES
jgi:excisionase family DNA binding protein